MRRSRQIGRIILGYLAACLTMPVLMFGVPGILALWSVPVSGPGLNGVSVAGSAVVILLYLALAAVVTAALTAIPAGIFIFAAEYYRITKWWCYALAGALIGMMAPVVLYTQGSSSQSVGLPAEALALFSVFGVAAATVYWFIAVRRQPRFRDTMDAAMES